MLKIAKNKYELFVKTAKNPPSKLIESGFFYFHQIALTL